MQDSIGYKKKGRESSIPHTFRESIGLADTLTSDFWPLELEDKLRVALSHPEYGTLLYSTPRET